MGKKCGFRRCQDRCQLWVGNLVVSVGVGKGVQGFNCIIVSSRRRAAKAFLVFPRGAAAIG